MYVDLKSSTLLLYAILVAPAVAVANIQLVRNGKPSAVILVPEDASHVTTMAAREMQTTLRKISGAELPIHVELGFSFDPDYYWLDRNYALICIGTTQLAKQHGVGVAELEPEGFRIVTKGNILFILGREDRIDTTRLRSTKWLSLHWPLRRGGTLFGVFAFLEDTLGIRWLWPGELGEVVPKRKNITIRQIDRVEAPDFPIRKVRPSHMVGMYKQGSSQLNEPPESMLTRAIDADLWAQRMRMGESIVIDQTHAYGTKFWETYGNDHPEWFAMQPDGNRMKQPQIEGRVRLCHSNRQLHQEVAGIVLGKIDQNSDVWSIGIGLDDTSPETFCQCETCKDFGPTLTDRVVRFASAIAEQVAQQHPDRRVSMFAYADWRDPPIEMKLHSHVVVVYVGVYTHGYLLASDRAANHKLWDGWAQMIDGKMVWRPNMPESLGIPILYAHQWAEDMRRFAPKAWGADVDALRGSWAAAGLNQYVMARLLWKMDQDVDAIIDDYCETGFGPAANAMRRYFTVLEQYTVEAAKQAPAHGYNHFCPWAPSFYTDQRITVLEAHLEQAEKIAGNDTARGQRVRFVRTALDWTKLALPAWAIYAADGDRAKVKPLVRRMYAYLREHRESYAIYSGYLASKMGWLWKDFFGEEDDWNSELN